MIKTALILILGLLVFQGADAQKKPSDKDTLFYYIKTPNQVVKNINDADYLLFVLPVDPTSKKKLYPIAEYYTNGKLKLVGMSINHSKEPVLDGACTFYFYNGAVESIKHFEDGLATGVDTSYYPNGKIYTLIERDGFKSSYILCSDTVGHLLTQNGNGKWLNYDSDFTRVVDTATVINGHMQIRESRFITPDEKEKGEVAIKVDTIPQFPGGLEALMRFLTRRIQYPDEDRKNNIQGRVIIQFVVEKDGTLSNIKAVRGPSQAMKDEAIRVVKLFPKWIPGSAGGVPVRVAFTLPINFGHY